MRGNKAKKEFCLPFQLCLWCRSTFQHKTNVNEEMKIDSKEEIVEKLLLSKPKKSWRIESWQVKKN